MSTNEIAKRFEGATLEECEAVIRDAGKYDELRSAAFQRIYRGELWRGEHKSFAAYAKEVWGIEKAMAYRVLGLPKPPSVPRKLPAPEGSTCTEPVNKKSTGVDKLYTENTCTDPAPEVSLDDVLGPPEPLVAAVRPASPASEPEPPLHMKRAWEQEKRMERAVGEFAGAMLQLCRQFPREGWPYEAWGAQLNNMIEIVRRDLKRIERKSADRAAERAAAGAPR